MNTSPKQYYQCKHSLSISCHHLRNVVQQSWSPGGICPCPWSLSHVLRGFRSTLSPPPPSCSFGWPSQKKECWFLYKDYSLFADGPLFAGWEKLEPTQLFTPPSLSLLPPCSRLASPSFFSFLLLSSSYISASSPKLFDLCPKQIDYYTNIGQQECFSASNYLNVQLHCVLQPWVYYVFWRVEFA